MTTQINAVTVDQLQTFDTARLMEVNAEIEFGTTDTQAKTKGEIPKWIASVAVSYVGNFGKRVNEVIEVKIASMSDPGKDVTPFNPVTLNGLRMFVQPKTNKDRQMIPGMTQSFSAESITDNAATGSKQTPKTAAPVGGES